MDTKSQNSNMLLAFLTLTGVIAIVALVGFFMLRKGPEIIQGQAEVTEYRVSSKVPGRILEFRVKEGQSVQAGDTLAILEAPDVQAKLEQARAAEAAAQAQNEKSLERRPPGTDTGSLRNMAKSPGRTCHCRKIVQTRKEPARPGSDVRPEAGRSYRPARCRTSH